MIADAIQAMTALETLVQSLMTLENFESVETRRTLVGIRRKLPEGFLAFERAVIAALVQSDENSLPEFKKRYADMKRIVLMHQGSWSAAVIDLDIYSYKMSLDSAYLAFCSLIAWTHDKLNQRK